jgi:hypothetical protein
MKLIPEKINIVFIILRLSVFAGVAKPGQRRKVEGLVLIFNRRKSNNFYNL